MSVEVINNIFHFRPKSKEDLLYQVPENINVRSKIMASEEMLSNQMLSGIPEVDLGIEAKIRNIEATEEAKQKVIEEQKNKKSKGPTEMVPTNMAVNFMLHSRCKLTVIQVLLNLIQVNRSKIYFFNWQNFHNI